MKKFVICLLAVTLLLACITPATQAAQGRGGFMGFIAGCCFGIRAGMDYNDGKEIHWREWIRIIPYVGLVIGIWDGIEGSQGKTRSEYAAEYGAMYY
ncbi:hypothetical protein ACFLS1_01590 [Verrucomicrobiota bacterium]